MYDYWYLESIHIFYITVVNLNECLKKLGMKGIFDFQ